MAKNREERMTAIGGNVAQQLRSYAKRVEEIDKERKALAEDRRAVVAEVKSMGFDPKVFNHVIKLRKMDKDDLDEFDNLVDMYKRAIDDAPDQDL